MLFQLGDPRRGQRRAWERREGRRSVELSVLSQMPVLCVCGLLAFVEMF